MQHFSTQTIPTLAFLLTGILLTGILLSGPALADRPAWAGGGASKQGAPEEAQGRQRAPAQERYAGTHFDDRQRSIIRDYYGGQSRGGRCPPGLAKKNTGCLPPGQAKKWASGQALPRDVVYDDLPPRVTVQLGTPPAGNRYVRVASDILLIAVGTGMVVDAIEDLGRQ